MKTLLNSANSIIIQEFYIKGLYYSPNYHLNNFKKFILLLTLVGIVLLYPFQQLFAQDASYSVGLRGGATSGITLRQYTKDNNGLEGILSFTSNSFKVTFLKEKYTPSNINFSDHFYFVKGVGGHAGYTNTDHYTFLWHTYYNKGGNTYVPSIGMDAVAGLEYRMVIFPLIFGIDWKPYFEFSTFQIFHMNIWDIGFYAKFSLY
jgi:hypothetical protein